jgi:hypothetical protein
MNPTFKTLVFWLVILVSAFLLWQVVKANPSDQNVPRDQLLGILEEDREWSSQQGDNRWQRSPSPGR